LLFGQIFFRQNGCDRTFRNTGSTVDARIWIDIIPGPFVLRLTRDNALDRADFYTGSITNAEIKNYMSQLRVSFMKQMDS
jgi:hypothetical protein